MDKQLHIVLPGYIYINDVYFGGLDTNNHTATVKLLSRISKF